MTTTEDAGRSLADRQRQLETLERLSGRFGESLTGALSAGAASGKQLSAVLDGIASSLTGSLGRTATSALQTVLTSGLQGAAQALTAAASSLSCE